MSKAPVNVKDIPPDVRAAVEREAADKDVSLTYAVGSVVARALDMPYVGAKGYGFRGTTGGAQWVIQLPRGLKDALQARAQQTGAAMSRLIVAMLAEHHGLPIPSTKDRRGVSQPRDHDGKFGQRSR